VCVGRSRERSDRSASTDGTWTVIDWDNIEADPAREWDRYDEEDRAYIKANYPDDYAKYFAALEGK